MRVLFGILQAARNNEKCNRLVIGCAFFNEAERGGYVASNLRVHCYVEKENPFDTLTKKILINYFS